MKSELVAFFLLTLISQISCQESSEYHSYHYSDAGYEFKYDLHDGLEKIKLPGVLVEISGLGRISDKLLACVQDEKGNIYYFDLDKKEVTGKTDFGKSGDYEGVEVVGSNAYVARSDGDIYVVPDFFGKEDVESTKTENFLDNTNDIEGLGYDPIQKVLLAVCKGKSGITDENYTKKSIYKIEIPSMKVDKTPYMIIDLDHLKKKIGEAKGMEKLVNLLQGDNLDFNFNPSGVAVHPVSGDLYVIASSGNLLIVYSSDGKVKYIEKLHPKIYKQPEGITFLSDGTLCISNEGRNGSGNILIIKQKA
jgi:DNA-binding beta-propeller fold protein YncE